MYVPEIKKALCKYYHNTVLCILNNKYAQLDKIA